MSTQWTGAPNSSVGGSSPWAGAGAALPSDRPDPFASVGEVRFLFSFDLALPGQFKLWDDQGRSLGQVRRDGSGWRAFLMSFALEDAEGRPLLLIRHQTPTHLVGYGTPFALLNPAGVKIGELTWSARQSATLALAQGPRYQAAVSGWAWKGFDVLSGPLKVAVASRPNALLPTPGRPGGLRLEFVPGMSRPPDHVFLVALAAFICVFRPPTGFPT